MKHSIIAMALLPMCANALDVEIGTGTVHYKTAHDGLWYQGAYPHTEDLNAVPLSLGLSAEYNNTRYRAEYLYLDWMYNSSQYVSDANYYAGTHAPAAGALQGRGSAAGVVLSASRQVPVFGLPFYVEAGAWLYVPKYKVTATSFVSGRVNEFETERAWKVGPALGLGIRYEGIDISIRYLSMQHGGDEVCPPIYNHAYTLMFKVYF